MNMKKMIIVIVTALLVLGTILGIKDARNTETNVNNSADNSANNNATTAVNNNTATSASNSSTASATQKKNTKATDSANSNQGTSGLQYSQKDGSYVVSGYTGSSVNVVTPNSYNNIPVIAIDGRAFAGSEVQTIEISEGIKSIGVNAFKGSTLLKSVVLPSSLEKLVGGCFENCTSLTTVSFRNDTSNLKVIGNGAFRGCSKLTKFDVPSSVYTIEHGAFSGCTSIKSINITVSDKTSFYDLVFEYWTSQQTINLTQLPSEKFNAAKYWAVKCDAVIKVNGKTATVARSYEEVKNNN